MPSHYLLKYSQIFPFRRPRSQWVWLAVLSTIGLLLLVCGYLLTRAPEEFPLNTPITIKSGLTTAEIADQFEKQHVVRSSELLYFAIILLHDPVEVKAGSYIFHEPHGVFAIARQITDDNPPTEHVSLTFYEGSTVNYYASVAEQYLPEFDSAYFLEHAQAYEGFLFPDTYFVPYSFTADQLLQLLRETYKEQVVQLLAESDSDLTENDVITLASLLEREANSEESMRTVAGILLNRLDAGMPLQLDASMEYVIDKPLNELTPEDLAIDSPYNTYLYRGLPPTPIGNPGIRSIRAVLNPIESEFFYYITGNDGNFYYAETYEEHLNNIERYLK